MKHWRARKHYAVTRRPSLRVTPVYFRWLWLAILYALWCNQTAVFGAQVWEHWKTPQSRMVWW
jgi:hypothetical protein